jgi:hypothetical protein
LIFCAEIREHGDTQATIKIIFGAGKAQVSDNLLIIRMFIERDVMYLRINISRF